MASCPVCDGEEFEELDGLFYCVVCNTQSQTLRTEQAADPNVTKGLRIREKVNVGPRRRVNSERGIPWQPEDAFHIILSHQIDALIRKGVNPKIKAVAVRLWTIYMLETAKASSVTGRDESLEVHMAQLAPRNRDIQSKELKISSKEVEKQNEKWRSRQISRVKLKTTIYTCYLALQFVDHTVTAGDLHRWMCDGSLPFINCEQLIPDEMVLNKNDIQMFKVTIPAPSNIIDKTSQLMRYLEYYDFPNIDLKPLAVKMVELLNLPGEIHGMVQRMLYSGGQVYRAIEESYGHLTIHPMELIVTAYIIVIMKMLFGLDDDIEHLLSTYARAVNEICPDIGVDKELFIPEDWMSTMEDKTTKKEERKEEKQEVKLPCNACEALTIRDTKLLEELPTISDEHFDKKMSSIDIYMAKQTRSRLATSVKDLQEKHHPKITVPQDPSSSQSSRCESDAGRATLFHHRQDFRATSIAHVTKRLAFEQHLSDTQHKMRRLSSEQVEMRKIPKCLVPYAAVNMWITETKIEENSETYQRLINIVSDVVNYPPEEINSWVVRLEYSLFKSEILSVVKDRKTVTPKLFPGFYNRIQEGKKSGTK